VVAQEIPDTVLARRLERAERMIELLREQINQQARGRVEPRAGNRVELSGTVLLNGFYNSAKVNSADLPLLVLPPDPPGGLPAAGVGGTARQSRIVLTATAPDLLGGSFTGELDADFYGGQLVFGRMFPLLHLRRARGEMRWAHASLLFGQEAMLVSDVNPSTLAAIGVPGFSNAGNLWFWIPQLRVGLEGGSSVKIGAEAAVLAPTSLDVAQNTFNPQPDRAELSRRPYFQARVIARWDRPGTQGQVSLGGHYGWLATPTPGARIVSKAVAATAQFTASRFMEIRAEAFSGRALGGLGGGGVGQNLGVLDVPVRTRGGWGQLNIRPVPEWEVGGGYGIDDPTDVDLDPATARLKNATIEGHVHWRPRPLLFGLEIRRVETTYGAPTRIFAANHVNLAAGFEF
jgi:hypothetical protein